jgi:hypothetical protein
MIFNSIDTKMENGKSSHRKNNGKITMYEFYVTEFYVNYPYSLLKNTITNETDSRDCIIFFFKKKKKSRSFY